VVPNSGNRLVLNRGNSAYDNALAETVIGLFKTEVIYARGPWRSLEAVEYATLKWVDWFNHCRLLEPIGYVPPAQFEREYYQQNTGLAIAA
jgi:putative transposase